MDYVKNGIFHRNNKPTIGLGVGYYASFHPDKYMVPPDGDRVGEMKKDIADMAALGFNFVRTSALGDMHYENGSVVCSYPFPDALIETAAKHNMAVMMRLNGYSMNMRGQAEDVTQRDQDGRPLAPYRSFITDCIHHPTVIEDNRMGTEAVARHFSAFGNVALSLIYNEPAYSPDALFDYHPCTIAAYRKWLVETGRMSNNEAENYVPPKRRPYYDEPEEPWINWRLFLTEAMGRYLGDTDRSARRGNASAEAMTCMTAASMSTDGVVDGEDIFDAAREMDILGVTNYLPCFGEPFWFSTMFLDCLDSAARLYGKHVWAAECNAHTTLTAQEWERETYTLLGGGLKGLFYYQWRADYDNRRGPEIGAFGILHNNREKTAKYSAIGPMNRLVSELGGDLAVSERMYMPVAILYSKHVNAFFDARENGVSKRQRQDALAAYAADFNPGSYIYNMGFDRNMIYMQDIHRELRKAGCAPVFVRAEDLKENRLGIKELIIPSSLGLSDWEKRQINEFAAAGGMVFDYQPEARFHGYVLLPTCQSSIKIHRHSLQQKMGHSCTVEDTLLLSDVKIGWRVVCDPATIGLNILRGPEKDIAVLTNYDSFERPVNGAVLKLDRGIFGRITKACMVTPEGRTEIEAAACGDEWHIELQTVKTGCFVILEREVEKAD